MATSEVICCFLCALLCVRSEVVGSFIMPHGRLTCYIWKFLHIFKRTGGIALSPAHFNTTNETTKYEAWMLHKACLQAGYLLRQLNPELIVLSTPHGLADLKQFMFYLNSQGYGFADTDNCVCPSCCYNVSVPIDANTSLNIVQQLQVCDCFPCMCYCQ